MSYKQAEKLAEQYRAGEIPDEDLDAIAEIAEWYRKAYSALFKDWKEDYELWAAR